MTKTYERITRWWICECGHENQTTKIIIKRGFDYCEKCDKKADIENENTV